MSLANRPFTVGCSWRYLRLEFPLVSLFFSSLWSLSFPRNSFLESVPCIELQPCGCGRKVLGAGGEAFCKLKIESLVFYWARIPRLQPSGQFLSLLLFLSRMCDRKARGSGSWLMAPLPSQIRLW